MIGYVIVSVTSGILFGVMDALINANLIAQRLFEAYKPVSRLSVNVPAGVVVDLLYGFIMGEYS